MKNRTFVRFHPMCLIILMAILPILLIFFSNHPFVIFSFFFSAGILICTGKFRRVLKFSAAAALIFGLMVFAKHTDWGFFKEVVAFMGFSTLMLLPILMLATAVSMDLRSGEILSALEQFRLPKKLALSLTVMIRFIPTFRTEMRMIRESMKMRHVKISPGHPIRALEYFLVPMLFRSAIVAEEMTSAALTKGVESPALRSSYYDRRLRQPDFWMVGVFVLALVIFYGGGVLFDSV